MIGAPLQRRRLGVIRWHPDARMLWLALAMLAAFGVFYAVGRASRTATGPSAPATPLPVAIAVTGAVIPGTLAPAPAIGAVPAAPPPPASPPERSSQSQAAPPVSPPAHEASETPAQTTAPSAPAPAPVSPPSEPAPAPSHPAPAPSHPESFGGSGSSGGGSFDTSR